MQLFPEAGKINNWGGFESIPGTECAQPGREWAALGTKGKIVALSFYGIKFSSLACVFMDNIYPQFCYMDLSKLEWITKEDDKTH